MNRAISLVATAVLVLASSGLAQTSRPASPPNPTAGLPPGWEEIDPRFVFLTVRLASVETSLDAVNKAMKQAGYKQSVKQSEAERFQKGNELMDRNAGGPARWQDFYGKTAEKFFYHPTDRNSSYHTETLLTQKNPQNDAGGVPSGQGLPVAQRPPQFDYIYRANTDAQKRTEAEIAKLAGKMDALVARQRQLEAQQAALWCAISFRAVSSRDFSSKALYRFQLKISGADDASKQKQEAINAATAFVRSVDHAMADAESSADTDPSGAFDLLSRSVTAAWKEVDGRVIVQQTLLLDMDDSGTTLGRFMSAARRLPNVTKNIPEANRLALEGSQAGDDQEKQTMRAALQQSLFDCAANLYTANDCVLAMAKEWKASPDVGNPLAMLPVAERPDAGAAPPIVKEPETRKPDQP